MLRTFLLIFLSVISVGVFAQKDLPNPPSDYQYIPAGSFVVAMDTAYQKLVPAGQAFFNLKAYGLINQFLQKQFPVKWAIHAGKSLNGIDFSAVASRAFPSVTPPAPMNFRGGPFIIPDTTICGVTTQSIIQSFGNNVCVYRLVNPEIIDIRYTISNAPKIAIFTNGGNQAIHAKILTAAGITNFDYLDAANIGNLNNCYTLVSEPHWDFNDADSVVVNGVKNFVSRGGNFFAQCQALETYENWGFFSTTSGLTVLNKNVVHTYHNADLPILQISGLVMENQGGSVRNWSPKAGSFWKSTTYKVISHNGSDTVVSIGMHLSPPTMEGGNAFFLGSHDYYSLTNLKSINALRMYLNAVFIPSVNNNLWARAGIDQTMTCAGAASLGCAPTGPPGSTYSWSPPAGLSCTNCPNPFAIPLSSTNYTVTVTNTSGCTATDNVMISTNLVYPDADFSMTSTGTSVCVNAPVTFTDQSTNGAVGWSWDFGDGDTSNQQNPVHAFANPGAYTVTLTATNGIGCTNSAQQNVTVNSNPVINFSFSPPCFGHTICFTNSSAIASGSIATWAWDFGDTASGSNSSSLQDPCHSFVAADADITLTATSDMGCQSTLSQPISFGPDPVASFSSTVSCEMSPTCFTDLSTVSAGAIVQWDWNFNDPTSGANDSASTQNPCHTYEDFSGGSAELTVTTDKGCQSTVSMPVSFIPTPATLFAANTICMKDATCFTNMSAVSSGSITGYEWNFGDISSGTADSSSLSDPCHTYSSAGTFVVTLISTSDQGCQSSASFPVTVHPLPVVEFTPSWACFGTQTCFTDLSTIASGAITNYNWSFKNTSNGSTDTSTLQNPCYLFSTYNPYDVTLILTSDFGCSDTLQKNILVSPNPVANFSSTVVCPGIATCFSDLSTISSGSITGWEWNFSDPSSGASDSSSLQNPCHTFINNSSPQVSLTVTSDVGCQNTITQPANFNALPVADFNFTSTCFGAPTSFTNVSNISSGSIVTHSWTFGEPSSGLGNVSVSNNPSHTYSSAGDFNVTLTIISNYGCQSSVTQPVSIDPVPVVNFSASPVCFGSPTCFADLSSVTTGSIVQHDWNFGDALTGTANNSALQNPCHIFTAEATYNIREIVTSDKGCKDTLTTAVTIYPVPAAGFASTIVCPGDPTCFTDLSSISSGTITGHHWNFSDPLSGTADTSILLNPCHTFINNSSPQVTLTVTSNRGCSSTVQMPAAFNPVPVADFNSVPACLGNPTCFTDLSAISAGTVQNWRWTFGDSSGNSDTSSLKDPCFNYSTANTFNAVLQITSDKGCQSSVAKPVAVYPLPVANFSTGITCEGDSSCFTDMSSIPSGFVTSCEWDFGDPASGADDSSRMQNPCHIFRTLSNYDVTLILTSDHGCKDTLTAPVAVSPEPVADFTSTIVCPGDPTCFSDLSTIPSGTIVTYKWDFDDAGSGGADSSDAQDPCHTFINTISPDVSLTLTSDKGCMKTISLPVTFNALPVADFQSASSCFGGQSCFSDLSSIGSGMISSRQWNFGDGASGVSNYSSQQNDCHVYSATGAFDVTLTVQSDYGCRDSMTLPVSVFPLPVPRYSTNSTCQGNQSCFNDLSTVESGFIVSYDWDFGDPSAGALNNSAMPDPCHLFSTLNSYNVKLTLVTDHGCSDSVSADVAVSPLPVTDFSSSVVCPGQPTCFTDLSSIPTGSIVRYDWMFSDTNGVSGSSTLQNPCFTFTGNMQPLVSLTTTSDSGCESTVTFPVGFNPVPTADFVSQSSCYGGPSCFTNLSLISSGSVSASEWNFGDMNSASNNSALMEPCHDYSAAGSFIATLSVMSDKGCADSISFPVTVYPLPSPDFVVTDACMGDQTCFTDHSAIASGSITSYNWNFNDPASGADSISSLTNPCHLFTTLNAYNVSLILTSDHACTDTLTNTITISPVPAAAFISTKVCPGAPTCFTDQSTIQSGSIAGWEWKFMSNGLMGDSSVTRNSCYTYSDTSMAIATLNVISDKGCKDNITVPVSFNGVPVPGFSVTPACYGSNTCFSNASTIEEGMIANYNWNFGDNNSGAANNSAASDPCHSFTSPGDYDIVLVLTSDKGCNDTLVRNLRVNAPPVAKFVTSPVCINSESQFTDQSTHPANDLINKWEWSFGDSSENSLMRSPVHLYRSTRTFEVQLEVTTASGCKDSTLNQVTVHARPLANVSAPQQGCAQMCEQFSDLSSAGEGAISGWSWKFPGGDPSYSFKQNPVVCYNSKGIYPVSLIVVNSLGCADTFYTSQQTKVYPVPEADFYITKEPDNLTAPELSLGHMWSNDVISWYWDFGDSMTDSIHTDPSHTYTNAVMANNYYNFRVALNVKNQFGCLARVSREINIKPAFSFFIPNTFTPNGDYPNDNFFGKGRGISEYKISIFDRWGVLLWACQNEGDFREWDKDNGDGMPSACKWDGIYHGSPVQGDTYVWKVELKNTFGQSFKYVGHVNVVR